MGERGWQLETGGFPGHRTNRRRLGGRDWNSESGASGLYDARLQFYTANWEKTGALCIPNVGMVLDLMTVSRDLLPASVGTLPVVAD